MSSMLIRDVHLNGQKVDVCIKGNRFSAIGSGLQVEDMDTVIDGRGKAILPPFYNCHTHAAMTLLRGYADDLELFTWLNEYIWPMEAKLREEDIYAGARLACLEMIKSGTVFFADMYWHDEQTMAAVEEMGMRAALGQVILDTADKGRAAAQKEKAKLFLQGTERSSRIIPSICPHAIYTVTEEDLVWCAEMQKQYNAFLHIHVAETRQEVDDCIKKHRMSPVAYLDILGCLGHKTIGAHGVHLSSKDMELLALRQVKIVHNPVSNMKLASGALELERLFSHGVDVCLGTDGCSSNNNLDMGEEMKFTALLAKHQMADPAVCTAHQAFDMATVAGARAFGIDAGVIAEGKLADCMLVDLSNSRLVPGYNLISNMVYSADSSCIDTVICDGRVLMHEKKVEGEEDIIACAKETCERLSGTSN